MSRSRSKNNKSSPPVRAQNKNTLAQKTPDQKPPGQKPLAPKPPTPTSRDPRSPRPVAPTYSRTNDLILLLLTLLTLAGMYRAVVRPFNWWDDQDTIHHNPALNPVTWDGMRVLWTEPLGDLYIPVTYTVWAGLAKIAYLQTPDDLGIHLNSWIFYGFNVTLHLGSVLIVFLLLQRLKIRPWPAAIGAAVFAVHPIQVEPVAWASGLKDLLWGFFAIASMYCWIRYAQADKIRSEAKFKGLPVGRGFYIAAAALMFLGTFSKPTAIVIPLLLWGVDYFIIGRSFKRIIATIWPLCLLALPAMIITKLVQVPVIINTQDRLYSPLWARPLLLTDALSFYLQKVIAPVNLCVDYGRAPQIIYQSGSLWWTWIFPVGIGLLAWLNRKRWPWMCAACVIFVGSMLPVLGLVPFLYAYTSMVTDHYMYVAMLGVGLAVAMIAQSLWRYAGAWIIEAVIILILAGLSWRQCGFWKADMDIWEHTLAVNPQSYVAWYSLACMLDTQALPDKLVVAYSNGHVETDAQKKAYRDLTFTNGLTLSYVRQSLRINPIYQLGRISMAEKCWQLHRYDEAIENLRAAAQFAVEAPQYNSPALPQALNMFGVQLARMQRFEDSEEFFHLAMSVRPGYAPPAENLKRLPDMRAAAARLFPAATQPSTTMPSTQPSAGSQANTATPATQPVGTYRPGERPLEYLPILPG